MALVTGPNDEDEEILLIVSHGWLQILIACEQCFAIHVSDLTHAQLKSVVYLLRESIKRLPEAYQRCFFSNALAMGESSLKKVEVPQRCSPVTFSGVVTAHCVTSRKETAKITQKQMTPGRKSDGKVQICSIKHKSDARVLKAVAVNKATSKEKQNESERPTDLRPAPSKSAACTTKHTFDFVKPSPKVTAIDLRELTKGSLNSPVQKTQTKYTSDITKYILKYGKVTLYFDLYVHSYILQGGFMAFFVTYMHCCLLEEALH